jgi:hypothetical protein
MEFVPGKRLSLPTVFRQLAGKAGSDPCCLRHGPLAHGVRAKRVSFSPSVSCLSLLACNTSENGQTPVMRVTLFLLLAGLAIAALVYVVSGGHVIFLPLTRGSLAA